MVATQSTPRHSYAQSGYTHPAASPAQQLYAHSDRRSWTDKVKSIFKGPAKQLIELNAVVAQSTVLNSRFAGVQKVSISQIRGTGSKGRSQDFDADFNLLNTRNEARWLSVAAAWQQGKLAPVSLVQVGNTYFVQDGHHRLSVVRAAGQDEIEAEVTVLELAEPALSMEAAAVTV
jgi:hypothetical protein